MPVKGGRDVLPKPLSHRHPGGRGQLMAIGSACAARARAPAGIQGSKQTQHIHNCKYCPNPVTLSGDSGTVIPSVK